MMGDILGTPLELKIVTDWSQYKDFLIKGPWTDKIAGIFPNGPVNFSPTWKGFTPKDKTNPDGPKQCFYGWYSDDTLLTLALAKALVEHSEKLTLQSFVPNPDDQKEEAWPL